MNTNNVVPEFNSALFRNIKPQALDVFYDAYPDTPVFLVIKRMGKASPTFYKALVCTYTGWWHGLQGWNIENKDVKSWELIEGYCVSDFTGKGIRLALTPEEYEENKEKGSRGIVEMILKGEFKKLDYKKLK